MTKFPGVWTYRAAKNIGVSQDLNNLVGVCGLFESDTPTNGPGTGVWFVEVMSSGVDGYVSQKANKKGVAGKSYKRTFNGTTWSGWVQDGLIGTQAAPGAMTVSATISTANLLAGWVTGNQGGAGAAVYTLPIGSVMDAAYLAAYPGAAVGDTIDFTIINLSVVDAEDITLTAAASFTVVGNAVVEGKSAQFANASGTFRLRRAAADTWVAYRIS